MGKFDKPFEQENNNQNLTLPVPACCSSCGVDFDKEEIIQAGDSGYSFKIKPGEWRRLICRDKNRENKAIAREPSFFMKKNKDLSVIGNASAGYVLEDRYSFVEWVVWCNRCHERKVSIQKPSKTNLKGIA